MANRTAREISREAWNKAAVEAIALALFMENMDTVLSKDYFKSRAKHKARNVRRLFDLSNEASRESLARFKEA